MVTLALLLGIPTGILAASVNIAPWQTSELHLIGTLRWPATAAIHAVNWTALLLAWSVAYFGLRAVRERSRAQLRESELARALQLAQLRLLEAQLNPHFLFNVLNTVRSLIMLDPALAQEAVTRLARTLRYSLSSGREDLVPLERELAMVDDYLAIEALRLENRLNLTREISPSTLGVQIPVMLLQMLVENAIKHGIAELPEGGDLRIAAEIAAGSLILTVENTRPRTSSSWRDPNSIGLQNCRQRLDLLFGPRASVTLDITQADRAIARVSLPCAP
jgi:LytS/YehU family sensor histidine kinase